MGIGTANPDSSSILEIQSTNRGVLFPKVALQGANIVAPLTNPAKGLIVWNTGTSWGSSGFYYNDSNSVTPNWTKVASGAVMKTTLTDGKIWIGNASNIATEQDLSGDLTITNTGVGTISNNAVTSAKILNGTIANADIANNAVSGTKINITGNTDGSFMYYDGVDWVNLAPDTAGKILQTNGAGAPAWVNANTLNVNNIYTTDGTLTGNRIVSQGANKLTFLSSSINGFNVNDTMFSVDAANNRIGIGTTTPSFPIHEKKEMEKVLFLLKIQHQVEVQLLCLRLLPLIQEVLEHGRIMIFQFYE
ncbi:MAG: hypothetical protein IPK03_04475 [Bacteroidetes bacterium]|nr:hypothetical protein [Bacteroidota bacterium]